jgi:arylsulfatase A-like enzyme
MPGFSEAVRRAAPWLLVLALAGCSGSSQSSDDALRRLFADADWVSVGSNIDLRRVFVAPVVSSRSESVSLPAGATLTWGVAAGNWTERLDLEARVTLRDPEGDTLLASTQIMPVRKGLSPWRDHRVDLSPWGGQTVELTFEARYSGDIKASQDVESPEVYWSSPRLSVAPRPDDRPVSVVLVMVDTLRADRLGAYGNPRDVSPAIDALAADGVVFENAFSQTNWTLPSVASLMTGLYPSRHGIRGNQRLLPDSTHLAPLMARSGYLTAAFHGGGYLYPQFGFDEGFDFYRRLAPAPSSEKRRSRRQSKRPPTRRSAWQADFSEIPMAVSWLEQYGGQPFFLFLHTYDVHAPYGSVPAEYQSRFTDPDHTDRFNLVHRKPARVAQNEDGNPFGDEDYRFMLDLYDGEIRYVDDQLGWFLGELSRLGLSDDVLVVLLADHGEEFGERGGLEHGSDSLHHEMVNVPLIFSGAGVPSGVRIEDPVQLVDVLPTLAELLGLEGLDPEQIDGRSFADRLGVLAEDQPRPSNRAISQKNDLWVIRSPEWTTMGNAEGATHLFDRTADPDERNNVLAAHPDVVERELQALRFLTRHGTSAEMTGEAEMNEDLRQELRALGYLD